MTARYAKRLYAPLATAGLAVASLLGGCASKPVAVAAIAPPPVPVAPVIAPMPKGAYPGMTIPVLLSDGSYATPNRNLTTAATVWHLRVALNVAALACRGPEASALVTGYNAMLTSRKALLTKIEATYSGEFRANTAGDWRDRYDDSMTRLYNFFSQSPARDAFCAAAAQVLADSTGVPAEGMAAFAAQRLPMLEAPFTDFYRAVDAWRRGQAPVVAPVAVQMASNDVRRPMMPVAAEASAYVRVASPAPAPLPPVQFAVQTAVQTVVQTGAQSAPRSAVLPVPAHPHLDLDPSVFLEPSR